MSNVIVSCKTPNGFIMEVNGVTQKINGFNSEYSILVYEKGAAIGITHDVNEDFWKAWLSKHKNHPLVTGGHVFISKSENSARSQAKEMKAEKTGMEQKTKAELEKVAGAGENPKDPS